MVTKAGSRILLRHSIASILKTGLDQQALQQHEVNTAAIIKHDNIRGASHYQSQLIY